MSTLSTPRRRTWRTPTVCTVDCRPEITAYSGDLDRPPVTPRGAR